MRAAFALAAALAAGASGAFAAEDALSVGAGLHYSSGDYGSATTTEITSLAVTARYERAPWTLKLTVPYVEIEGAADVIPGVGGNNARRRGGGTATSAAGLGDVVAAATYALYYDAAAQLGLDATGKLKLPTADADAGLGTGETDLSFQVDAYKSFDRLTPFVTAGYTLYGSSAALPLENAHYYALGASYRIDARDSAGVSYDARERITPGGGEVRELTVFFLRRLDRLWRTQLYFLKGLADGSPDWGLGASLAYSF